ncbi:MAG: hypothetical protein RLZZ603_826 [Actinomycetota bacterium]|jgi:hypothetical protein
MSNPVNTDIGLSKLSDEERAKQRRAKQTVNNLVYSLLATAAVVLIMVLIVPRPTKSLIAPVDYKAVALEASQSSNLPVVTPKLLGKDWYSNSARWNTKSADGVDNWYVGFVGPKNQYLGLTQGYGTNPTWTFLQLKGDLSSGTVNIGGYKWDVWQSTTKNDPPLTRDYALVTDVQRGSVTDEVIVYGTASAAEFRAFATEVASQLKSLYP